MGCSRDSAKHCVSDAMFCLEDLAVTYSPAS